MLEEEREEELRPEKRLLLALEEELCVMRDERLFDEDILADLEEADLDKEERFGEDE